MLKVVYKAYEGPDLDRVLSLLGGEGLHPVVVDEANPDGAMIYASAGTVRIRVAVPEEETGRAIELLRVDAEDTTKSTRRLARSFERGVVVFAVFGAAIAGIVALGDHLAPDFPWVAAGWLVVLLGVVFVMMRKP